MKYKFTLVEEKLELSHLQTLWKAPQEHNVELKANEHVWKFAFF